MIVILMGVSGVGKTTVGKLLGQELNWPFFDADDFHPPANIEKMARCIPLTDDDRWPWLDALQQKMLQQITSDASAIFACSALRQIYRERLTQQNKNIHFIFLRGSFEQIKARLVQRQGHYMSADLLASQFATLEEPQDVFAVDAAASIELIVSKIKDHLNTVNV